MSEPRTETHASAREIPLPGAAGLRELAARALAQPGGAAHDAATLAAAALRAYDALAQVTTPLLGRVGVDALTRRALHLAQREHAWLVDAPGSEPPADPFPRVVLILQRQDPALGIEGGAAVLAIFAGLLVTFIGESLTTGLLRKAWPSAFADARAEET